MSRVHIKRPGYGGICLRCSHDLETRKDGFVWCTNPKCSHFGGESQASHPTGKTLNIPEGVET